VSYLLQHMTLYIYAHIARVMLIPYYNKYITFLKSTTKDNAMYMPPYCAHIFTNLFIYQYFIFHSLYLLFAVTIIYICYMYLFILICLLASSSNTVIVHYNYNYIAFNKVHMIIIIIIIIIYLFIILIF